MNSDNQNQIAYFVLPDFLALTRNKIIIDIINNFPDIVRDNFKIYSFYGTFPKAIWNGGRVSINEGKVSNKFMKQVRDFYNKKGIKVTFTFTNCLIEERHLKDEYCNQMLKVFHNGMNEVLVVSPVLENYIKEKFPLYKINKSITFADAQKPYDTSKYHLSVIDKKYNNNFEKLEKIKEKEKIEILCDETCANDCKFTKQHYTEISRKQLGLDLDLSIPFVGKCRYQHTFKPYNRLKERNEKSKYYISPNDIYEKYLPLGYKYFKLSGRERYNIVGYESIINYLFKPEYHNDIKIYIYETMLMDVTDYSIKNINLIKESVDYI